MLLHCIVNGRELSAAELYRGADLRKELFELIQKDFPALNAESALSPEAVNHYRKLLLSNLVAEELVELDHLEKEVLDSISKDTILAENVEEEMRKGLSRGQRMADHIATFGGSWRFIISFFVVLMLWILVNTVILISKPFDPFPFILLNLCLSCLAAIQAPIIMMSQNRKEEKDRMRSINDYKVNLKSELEIRLMNEKIDHMIIHQNKRLLDIQELQGDYLEDILNQLKKNS